MKKIYWFRLLSCLFGALACGSIGMLLGGNTDFYNTISLPEGAPVLWLFIAAYFAGLVLLALAAYILFCTVVSSQKEFKLRRAAVAFFVIALASNVLLPLFLFRLEMLLPTFITTIVLFAAVSLLFFTTFKLNRTSPYFLFPYAMYLIYLIYITYSLITTN